MTEARVPLSPSSDEAGRVQRGFTLSLAPGLIGLVFGLLYSLGAAGYTVGTLSTPGPGLYPVFVGAVIIVSSLVYLLGEWRHPSAPAEALGEAFWRAPATIVALSVAIYLFKPAGYVIATTVLCAAMLAILGRRPLWLAGAAALATSLTTYFLFQFLGVPLPPGVLPI